MFNELIKGEGLNTTLRKGRNTTLMQRRNECLVARYYYWGCLKHKCYEDIVRQLVVEFYLSPNTITQLLLELTDQTIAMKKKSPTTYYLQMRWPHMRW